MTAAGYEINERDIAILRIGDAKWAAAQLDSRLRVLERQHRRSFIEIGVILNEMSDRQLWQQLVDPKTAQPFASFDRWLADAAPVSRSGGYAAMGVLRKVTDVSVAELQEMPRCNVMALPQLSPQVRRDPAVLAAAKTESEDEFLRTIETNHPDQHIETRRKMRFSPSRSDAAVIEEAIAWALENDIAGTREEALVRACEAALMGWKMEVETE